MTKRWIAKALATLGLSEPSRSGAARRRKLGDEARNRGDWAGAVGHYRAFLDEHPDVFAIWVQLGHASKESGDLGSAERAYLRAEGIDPEDSDLALNLGHLMKAQRRRDEAVSFYSRSFDLDGNPAARAELEALGVKPERNLSARKADDEGVFAGVIDFVDGIEVRGWAVERDRTDAPATIEVITGDGVVLATAIATARRPDVEEAGFGEGPHGFSAFIDAEDLAGQTVLADVRVKSTGDVLEGSPVTIRIPQLGERLDEASVTAARFIFAKPLGAVAGEHAIFVAYAPTGMLQPFVRPYLAMLADQGIAVSLVVNAERPMLLDDDVLSLVASAMVRENSGYDFGAWAHMLRVEPRLYAADALYIINDSVFGPRDAESFAATIAAVRANKADLVGLTQTLERGWHLQSYFLRASAALIASYGFQFFVNSVRVLANKDDIIDAFEVPLTARAREAGFDVDVVFKIDEARNPTLFAWRELLKRDFPFVKILLARGRFAHVDSSGLRKVMKRHGFDMDLFDATLAYGTDQPPTDAGYPLLARMPRDPRRAAMAPAKPYKVAFYGPWNYDNGLGSASRGIIAAIRHSGVRLNAYPIRVPFHVHKPLFPPQDVVDFGGPADIAIVHLNPDSWHLLTAEQRRDIGRARRRIGYWVWEMEHLPPLWRREFSSVDRIWAPSGYNAALYDAQHGAPVDVVPHAVPVDRIGAVDRTRVLATLDLPIERRTILYVFDGSSYLVRKNPAALVRAFALSGLGKRGWSLVLKTKHLMDRADEGAALAALADETDSVILLDRSLTAGELSDLVAACDIYASPHCAEGFGLTVAEAMAAGRPVVATDYSGTTQFLDATCGFPVPAQSWTLEEDFGHYTAGGTWARIDEEALAETLMTAAGQIEAGDRTIGDAARARIAEALSYETVGAAIAQSFDAVLGDTIEVRHAQPRLENGGAAAVPVARFTGGAALTILPLQAGSLTPIGDALAAVADDRDHWLMFVPEDAGVHPLTARIFARHAAKRPDVAIFHADDVALGEPTLLDQVRLKPEFDQTLFAADDYIGMPLFVRGSALHALGGLTADAGDATLYDLVLRAAEQGFSIGRVPEVLAVLPGERVHAPVAARRALLERSPLYAGYSVAPGLTERSLALAGRFEGGEPAVTICIPTARSMLPDGGGSYIERLLDSLATVDWPMDRLTVLIGDDTIAAPAWEARAWPFTLRRLKTPRRRGEPFNYSAKMNRLWRAAESEVVVLMNDDVMAHDGGWLAALIGFAVDRGVGGVGARLLYDDGTIQHAGTVGGVLGTSVHAWLARRATAPTYQDWAITQREWSMVTGAIFATRKGVLDAVGGFDEGFSLEFNDVDLCLKIRQAGWRIIYNPLAELTHSEKASRGDNVPPGEQTAIFLSRWQGWLASDPALPPRIRRDMIDLTPSAGKGDWFV